MGVFGGVCGFWGQKSFELPIFTFYRKTGVSGVILACLGVIWGIRTPCFRPELPVVWVPQFYVGK